MEEKIYDLVIIGGGPAGMSAGVYAKQMKLDTLLIEKESFGGQVETTSSVTNYLGFPLITGEALSSKMHEHLLSTGIELVNTEVLDTKLNNDTKEIITRLGSYKTKSVIIALGTKPRTLGANNERDYINKGISYNTLRDKDKYIDKVVAIVGGGNTAIEDAIDLSNICKKVYLIHRRHEFRADGLLVDKLHEKINSSKNIELVLGYKPHSIKGKDKLEQFFVENIETNDLRCLTIDGLFVDIGRGPDTEIIDDCVNRDEKGYIITNSKMETNINGVMAIGDIRNTPLRQIATAVGDGSIASVTAFNYIKSLKNK